MPRISTFSGLVITMYYKDHGVPHFHVRLAEHDVSIAVDTLAVLEGSLPGPALRLAREWAELHRDELRENWRRAIAKQPLAKIKPLP
jgi:hypothetical protein